MPNKSIPTIGDSNWGTPLNNHLSQLQNPNTGGVNTFDRFAQRPTNLTADDTGKTYLYIQTGNLHQWTGTIWKVLNESVINVKDYGAVGDGLGKTPADLGMDISNASWNVWPFYISDSTYSTEHDFPSATLAQKPFKNSDTWDHIGIQYGCWQSSKKILTSQLTRTEVYIPAGEYIINKGIYLSASMQMDIKGAGLISTAIKTKDIAEFEPVNYRKTLIYIFRTIGTARKLSNFKLEGNITFAYNLDTNNPTFDWLYGIYSVNYYSTGFSGLWIT